MSNAIERTNGTALAPRSLEEAQSFAGMLSKSGLLPDALRGKPQDVLVVLITGHELGLSPMQAVRGLAVIKGKAVASADLMVALAKRHTDVCRYFRMVESTPERATYETQRHGDPEPTRMTYTIQQAAQAGLANGPTWKAHPAAMLRARCSSALARAVYPDLLLGVYEEDEGREIRGTAVREAVAAASPAPAAVRQVVEAFDDAEVVEEAPPVADDDAVVDGFRLQIEAAQTKADLAKVGAQIRASLPDKDMPARLRISPIYLARQRELAQ